MVKVVRTVFLLAMDSERQHAGTAGFKKEYDSD
jgi:hypothetical protein